MKNTSNTPDKKTLNLDLPKRSEDLDAEIDIFGSIIINEILRWIRKNLTIDEVFDEETIAAFFGAKRLSPTPTIETREQAARVALKNATTAGRHNKHVVETLKNLGLKSTDNASYDIAVTAEALARHESQHSEDIVHEASIETPEHARHAEDCKCWLCHSGAEWRSGYRNRIIESTSNSEETPKEDITYMTQDDRTQQTAVSQNVYEYQAISNYNGDEERLRSKHRQSLLRDLPDYVHQLNKQLEKEARKKELAKRIDSIQTEEK